MLIMIKNYNLNTTIIISSQEVKCKEKELILHCKLFSIHYECILNKSIAEAPDADYYGPPAEMIIHQIIETEFYFNQKTSNFSLFKQINTKFDIHPHQTDVTNFTRHLIKFLSLSEDQKKAMFMGYLTHILRMRGCDYNDAYKIAYHLINALSDNEAKHLLLDDMALAKKIDAMIKYEKSDKPLFSRFGKKNY